MNNPIDAWLKFENEDDEEPTLEANTYEDNGMFHVEWYHSAVGLVTVGTFATLKEAHAWYERNGFANFTA